MAKPQLSKSKVCLQCGATYEPTSNRQRYCTACPRRGQSQCLQCDKVFVRTPNTTGKWCSVACRRAYVEAEKQLQCPICGDAFRRHTPGQKTCSPACADEIRRKPRADCGICGKPLERRRQQFCSRHCAMLARAQHGGPPAHRYVDGTGYIRIKVDGRWILEHRVVMSQCLGRSLDADERVHHKNGNRADNRPENLELWTVGKKDPAGQRVIDRITEMMEGLSTEDRQLIIDRFKE